MHTHTTHTRKNSQRFFSRSLVHIYNVQFFVSRGEFVRSFTFQNELVGLLFCSFSTISACAHNYCWKLSDATRKKKRQITVNRAFSLVFQSFFCTHSQRISLGKCLHTLNTSLTTSYVFLLRYAHWMQQRMGKKMVLLVAFDMMIFPKGKNDFL